MTQAAVTESATVVGVIDVGSSGIRMEVARVSPSGAVAVIETLSRSVPLGVDAFRQGHLSRATIDATVAALKNFQKVLGPHKVDRLRAVGTSALREVDNADTLLDRVTRATGIEIEVIDGAEENRLDLLAVENALRGVVDIAAEEAAIIEVGGGSVDMTLLEKGRPVASESQPLGTLRMLQSGRQVGATHARFLAALRRQIRSSVRKVERNIPLSKARLFVALGSEMRLVADQVGEAIAPRVARIGADAFRAYCKEVTATDTEALVARTKLSYAEAECLVPALLIYQELLSLTPATSLVVPKVSLRDGLILDLVGPPAGTPAVDLRAQVLSSAMALGRKYSFDESHAVTVAGIAVQLFDALSAEHGLGPEERLLGEVAALLHDVGLFIGSRAHHKHSHYLISASEIFGLSREELDVVANVARYHRRATPNRSHVSYMGLPRRERTVVNKLAAILRLADALDREHAARIKSVRIARGEEGLEIHAPLPLSDLEGEVASFEGKKGMFMEVFGMDVVLRGSAPP